MFYYFPVAQKNFENLGELTNIFKNIVLLLVRKALSFFFLKSKTFFVKIFY